jgi:TATA-box binding protein (TBP) (component of TFIID and TFIIIB)
LFINIFFAKITLANKITIHNIIKAIFGSKYDSKNFAIVIYKDTQAKIIDLHVDFAFQLVKRTTQ